MDTKKWFILILLLTLACAFVVVPAGKKPGFLKDIKITPGIDLAGGADLTYRILYKDEAEKRDQRKRPQAVIDVLRKRINQRGLKEPRLSTLDDDKVVIQLAVQKQEELNDYKDLLMQVGKLELKSVASREIHQRWKETGQLPAGVEVIENNEKMTGEYDYLGGDQMLLMKEAVIGGEHIKGANPAQTFATGKGGWKVHFELTDDGGKKFDAAAKDLFNQNPKGLIAIIMDGSIKSKPRIQSEKFGGSGEITGSFSKNEAENLAVILRSGQLPVAIGNSEGVAGKPESENFIGPTLAQDSLRRGVAAAVVATAFVALFMIFYYRAGGVVAVFSLVCNVLYLLTVMAVFGATLTLPGLAGLALTIGMAVDNNVLILERIREEMAKGKTALQAFEAGHNRAFSAILDSNVTTILAGAVLYYFGTDAVQGFATVLVIGILTTMLSVLVVGKMLEKILIQGQVIREFRMMKLWSNLNVNFLRAMPACVFLSLAAVAGSTALFATRYRQSLGMDFKGGVRVVFKLSQDHPIEFVRQRLAAIQGPDGKPLYPDAEVTAMGKEASSATKIQILATTASNTFQVRSSTQDLDVLKTKMQEAFAGAMSHEPFDPPEFREDASVKFTIVEGDEPKSHPAGGWFHLYLKKDGFDLVAATATLEEIGKQSFLSMNTEGGTSRVNLRVMEAPDAPAGFVKLRILFAKPDMKFDGTKPPEKYVSFLDKVKKAGEKGDLKLAESPFTAPGRMGPTAAGDLRDSTIWALIVSWALIIVYIAIRFSSWKFGASAVIALIHDAAIAIGFVVLCGWIVPKSWGLSFEMNVTTLAAILTVIGYSVNDKVVVFDRIRENLVLMKKEGFAEIVNTSVNQTMSRTLLTGLSVLVTCAVLYVFTMTSAGGVAEFALPLFVGILAGTYSSIYIANPLVLWLSGGQKPAAAK